jgi:hypothetical protein
MRKRDCLVWLFLVSLGSLQIAADALRLPRVQAVAAALQVSPAMKVFTAHQGYETHAARFSLTWQDGRGEGHGLWLDPESYARVRGPYNRRNVYGAAFAYGPLLRADPRLRPMQESVMRHAFCNPATLRAELGIPPDARDLTAHIAPLRRPERQDLQFEWRVNCHE